jgi:hypothetical protein
VRVCGAAGAADVLLVAEGVDHDRVLERACVFRSSLLLSFFLSGFRSASRALARTGDGCC